MFNAYDDLSFWDSATSFMNAPMIIDAYHVICWLMIIVSVTVLAVFSDYGANGKSENN